MTENKNSKARIAANNRYNAKAYDRMTLTIRKEWGYSALIEERAKELRLSKNEYILQLIEQDLIKAGKLVE